LEGARAALMRLDQCLAQLREVAGNTQAHPETELPAKFSASLDEDLNIAGAWGVIFDWVRETNRRLADNTINPPEAAAALATWARLDSVLGVGAPHEIEVPAEINALLEARQAARRAKDFKQGDAIRDELKAKGWIIEDTPKGARVKRL
jgi:cysteinyl-tRNA synthetase